MDNLYDVGTRKAEELIRQIESDNISVGNNYGKLERYRYEVAFYTKMISYINEKEEKILKSMTSDLNLKYPDRLSIDWLKIETY